MKDVEVEDIQIDTERLTGKDGKESNVSSIEITLRKNE
jgi:DNA-binding protein Alba